MRLIIFFVLMSFCGSQGLTQDSHPVSWQFSSESISAGTFRINITAAIREPFHIYPQSFDGGLGMPTTIQFENNPNVELIGDIIEKGEDSSNGKAVAYYAKTVTFSQTVKLKNDKKTTLRFRIKYMACNDEMCLPPASKEFSMIINDNDIAVSEKTNVVSGKTQHDVSYEDFVMTDTEGKQLSVKSISSQKRYTFIDFWASWCKPCRVQARALVPLYQKYSSRGFAVIGVSLDTNAALWKKAIRDDGYTWTNLSDLKGFDSPIIKKYRITAIPVNMLVDNKGNIVARDLHGKELEETLSKLFE
jgi:thiol-disulfide isomerase/thioredoxin